MNHLVINKSRTIITLYVSSEYSLPTTSSSTRDKLYVTYIELKIKTNPAFYLAANLLKKKKKKTEILHNIILASLPLQEENKDATLW